MCRRRDLTGLPLMLIALLCGCQTIDLPSLSDTSARMQGKVIWRDLLTRTPAASRHFYTSLFGWEFETLEGAPATIESDEGYFLIRHRGTLIGGLVDANRLNVKEDISQWIVLVSVDDIEKTTSDFATNGGEIIAPPTSLGRRGEISIVRDDQGAVLALLQTSGDPPDQKVRIGDFLWDEIWTKDPDRAARWYASTLGYQPQERVNDGSSSRYRFLARDGVPRVGILPNPIIGLEPVWVSYIRVEDPGTITARVVDLGGKVIVDPQPRELGGEVAFITGPSGAGIALQTWSGGIAE